MCGIACVVSHELPDPDQADTARDLMRHRGPDDAGSWRSDHVWLASRRLAIIDVGPSGHQPWIDKDTGTLIVFNGEIYNYVELRAELRGHGHVFETQSDTEVLLRAYLEWGQDCVHRLNGMWAFAVWDPRRNRLTFSRDRFGVKPLFTARYRDGIALASEPKVLLALVPSLRRADDVSIYRLLAEQRVYPDGRSFYADVRAVPAAHVGTFAPGNAHPVLRKFWRFPEPTAHDPCADSVEEFSDLFESSVKLRLRSDVPTGLTLSGGLDSTAVAHAARAGLGPDPAIQAYTSVYGPGGETERVDEREWAHTAVEKDPRTTIRQVPADHSNWLSVLQRVVWHMDGPGFSPAVFPLWQIMAQAYTDGTKVLLEGQGADELLGGYSWHLAASIADGVAHSVSQHDWVRARQTLRALGHAGSAFSTRRTLGDVVTAVAPPFQRWDRRRRTVIDALDPEFTCEAESQTQGDLDRRVYPDRLSERLRRDFAYDLLPGFLHYGDAISMAHSVEARLPFLDYRVVEFCFGLTSDEKIRAGESKAVLRSYLRRNGHGRIADRARKQGYPTPMHDWLAAEDGAVLREVLLDPGARVNAYVARPRLERLIDRHARGMHAAGDALFSLVSTELWLEECI